MEDGHDSNDDEYGGDDGGQQTTTTTAAEAAEAVTRRSTRERKKPQSLYDVPAASYLAATERSTATTNTNKKKQQTQKQQSQRQSRRQGTAAAAAAGSKRRSSSRGRTNNQKKQQNDDENEEGMDSDDDRSDVDDNMSVDAENDGTNDHDGEEGAQANEGEEDYDMDEDDEDIVEEEEMDDDDDDDESFTPGKSSSSARKNNKKKSTQSKPRQSTSSKNTGRAAVRKATKTTKSVRQIRPAGKKSTTTTAAATTKPTRSRVGGGGGRAATSALNALAKKIIQDPTKETPANSLVAALLSVHTVKKGGSIVKGVIEPAEPRKPPRCLETSLVNPVDRDNEASSLSSSKKKKTSTKTLTDESQWTYKVVAVGSEMTSYSQHLEGLARYIIRKVTGTEDNEADDENNDDDDDIRGGGTNALQVLVTNLIFRCVGGTYETNVPKGTVFDDTSDEDMDTMFGNVVEAMEESADDILIYADLPTTNSTVTISNGTGPNATIVTKTIPTPKAGPAAFRNIYKEFWYRLGNAILNHTHQNPFVSPTNGDEEMTMDDDSDSDEFSLSYGSKKSTQKKSSSPLTKNRAQDFSSSQMQVQMARDLVDHLLQFIDVLQPDIRMAGMLGIYSIAHACLERTVDLEIKIQTYTRHYKAASRQNLISKAEQIKHRMDTWKRHKADLENLVEDGVLKAMFMTRYRDINASIREESLKALQKFCIVRPDLFLSGTYLKYFGWMASDKNSRCRLAALEGFLAPLCVAIAQDEKRGMAPTPFPVEAASMNSVLEKFHHRIADSLLDIATNVPIQETAITLLNKMVDIGFLDDMDDDTVWDQINRKALDIDASPYVRKAALYFVFGQFEIFDADSPTSAQSEQKQEEFLYAIAQWVADKLIDGNAPIDKINIHLADLVVQSLLGMPEYNCLVRNWSMMITAMQNLYVTPKDDDKLMIAKQRVMLRFLIASAELDNDPGVATSGPGVGAKRRHGSSHSLDSRDALSTALMKNLPLLISAFKTDTVGLRDVMLLPLSISLSVFSLASRKGDLHKVMNSLCKLYTESTDEKVLSKIANVFAHWLEGDHARMSDIKTHLLDLSAHLQDRLMELFAKSEENDVASSTPSRRRRKKKRVRTPRSDDSSVATSMTGDDLIVDEASPEIEIEQSLTINLLRWTILLTACPTGAFFESAMIADNDEDKEEELAVFFRTISEGAGKRLKERMPVREMGGDDESTIGGESKSVRSIMTIPVIWESADLSVHQYVARTVRNALQVLLRVLAWKAADIVEKRSTADDTTVESDDEIHRDEILDMRKRLILLLGACFDQHLPTTEDFDLPKEQLEFASCVMATASKVSSDLRTLFPEFWIKARDPVISSLALTHRSQESDLTTILAGNARYFQARESVRQEMDAETFVEETVMPLARCITVNPSDYFRKEAALVLSHIVNSGKSATDVAVALTRILKKLDPIRLLESHMLCLRCSFDSWVDGEPEIEDGRSLTEVEEEALREKEARHAELYTAMEVLASKLSSTLGVGKITDKHLKKDIGSFFKEGIRWSFSTATGAVEDEYAVGSRLPFLTIVGKYGNWVKQQKALLGEIKDFLLDFVDELRKDEDFLAIPDADLDHLRGFAKMLGIPEQELLLSADDERTNFSDFTDHATTPSPRDGSPRHSRPSTAGSTRSRMSSRSNLSPLMEEDQSDVADEEEESSYVSPKKRRRLQTSLDGSIDTGVSSVRSRGTIEEEQEQDFVEYDNDGDSVRSEESGES